MSKKPVKLEVVKKTKNETEIIEGDTEKHEAIREKAKSLKVNIETKYWEMAMVLKNIFDNDLYRAWGYDSWTDYIDIELSVGKRTVQMYLQLQRWYENLPSDIQGWIQKLGWSKAKNLIGVVTPDNAGKWRNLVAGKTVREIEDIIKHNKEVESDSNEEPTKSGKKEKLDVPDEKPSMVKFSLFDAQGDNVKRAIDKAKEITESDKDGHNLDMVCLEFLANNTHLKDKKSYLQQVERILSCKIVALDESMQIFYGSEYLEEKEEE